MYEADSTQLYYVRARWYDPRTKRFMSPDPIGLAGGINPYAFAGNDPVNLGDASGMIAGSRGPCSLLLSCGGLDGVAYFGGMLGIDEGGGGGRPLNDAERQALGNLCKRRPDICAKARIYTSSDPNLSLLASLVGAMTRATNRPFTPGTVIFIPESREGDVALLAHELTHVGQFLDWGATAFVAAGIRSMTRDFLGMQVYEIPGVDPLVSLRFGQWGMEQQGSIVQNCFRRPFTISCTVSPYRP
jgi:RHS repeat-associated protein